MPSQIKVDEIKNVAGQYEIKTDTFKGQTTAGSITLQGEGSATTNLQQGLAKHFVNFNGDTSFGVRGGFNNASVTDHGTGDYEYFFTNNMSNTDTMSPSSGLCTDTQTSNNHTSSISFHREGSSGNPMATSSVHILTNFDGQSQTLYDCDFVTGQTFGDLA